MSELLTQFMFIDSSAYFVHAIDTVWSVVILHAACIASDSCCEA